MKCNLCDRELVALSFGYFSHPVLKDHFGNVKPSEYQCSKVGEIGKTWVWW